MSALTLLPGPAVTQRTFQVLPLVLSSEIGGVAVAEPLPTLVDTQTWVPLRLATRWAVRHLRWTCMPATIADSLRSLGLLYVWSDRADRVAVRDHLVDVLRINVRSKGAALDRIGFSPPRPFRFISVRRGVQSGAPGIAAVYIVAAPSRVGAERHGRVQSFAAMALGGAPAGVPGRCLDPIPARDAAVCFFLLEKRRNDESAVCPHPF